MRGKSKRAVSAATKKSRENLYRYKARNFRANVKKRSPDHPLPSIDDLEMWLRKQPLHCSYYGNELSIDSLHIDHIIALDQGGSHDLENLCLASPEANRAKGSMSGSQFHELLHLTSSWPDRGKALLSRLRAAGTVFGR
ncbi:HNH endonuclease [Sphingobium arseniciresistens]|uniref:HNH endonuclease n=1 Tax=Sphingobium arseniciresistens TaxID=3030834 RepID=UPI003BB0E533